MSPILASCDVPFMARFEELRQKLLDEDDPDKLDRTLAHWVSSGDRRLPLALMPHTLRRLLDTPFAELRKTPGVGQKKLAKLLKLLERAAADSHAPASHPEAQPGEAFDPDAVSEARWEHWRRAVRDSGMEEEPLGRFTCSLQELPRVVWWTPLGAYTGLTLAEIQRLKTHGVKRVRAIVRTFAALQATLGEAARWDHLSISVVPQFVRPLEVWLQAARTRTTAPSRREVLQRFVQPVLRQVSIDAGENIARLSAGRLGVVGRSTSVRAAAAELGLTRARVYQLLEEVGAIMEVRWPGGAEVVDRAGKRLEALTGPAEAVLLFSSTADLLFPRRATTNGESRPLHVATHRRRRAG